MRLDKALSLAGLTRSQAKRAVADGRAKVDGIVARDSGMNVDVARVTLDGAPIAQPGEVTLMVHKPAGLLTATKDLRLPTVMDLVPPDMQAKGLGPVGRLDRDVTGLVLLTTDGQLAHRLISPKRHVEKVYIADLENDMDDSVMELIRKGGLEFTDFVSAPAQVERIEAKRIRLTLTEGKFHEVKRICAKVGAPVVALKRISLAGVCLDPALNVGDVRPVTAAEAALLYAAAGLENTEEK